MADESDEEYSEFDSEEEDDNEELIEQDDKKDATNKNESNNLEPELLPNSDLESDEDEFNEEEEGNDGFMRPEVHLAKLKKENIELGFEAAKINRIKCLALTKILHGRCHWKVAEAHLDLANVYLKGKIYSLQVLKHAGLARDILLVSESKENSNMQYLLLNLYYVMGRGNLQLGKHKESMNCLKKAKLVSDKTNNATKKYSLIKVNILFSLATVLSKLGHVGQAAECLEDGIDNAARMSGDESKSLQIKLHKQNVSLELQNKEHANLTRAEDSLKASLQISIEINGEHSSETAEIYILSCKIENLKEMIDFSKIETNLQNALEIYKEMENMDKYLSTQLMLCKVMIQQEKLIDAKNFLEKCITECETIKGDMALITAEFYELIGSVLFALNRMSNALSYFLKAAEIYKGKKKHIKKQEKISKIIEIIRKSSKDEKVKTSADKLKERPRFY